MKKLLVVEDPEKIETIKMALENDSKQIIKDDYVFDCYCFVCDRDSSDYFYGCRLTEDYETRGLQVPEFKKLSLNSVSIPDKEMYVVKKFPYAYVNDGLLEEVDEFIFNGDCLPNILASVKYIEDHGLDFSKARYVVINDLENVRNIIDNLLKETDFQDVLVKMEKVFV